MRSRLLTVAAILAGALLTTMLDGRLSLAKMLGWAIFFTGMLWPYVFGRSKPPACRLPGLFRRG